MHTKGYGKTCRSEPTREPFEACKEFIYEGALPVKQHGTHTYPVRTVRLDDDTVVAVVYDVWPNPSPMNASQDIMEAVQSRWPGAKVLEAWRCGTPALGPQGLDGCYAWSSGNGGSLDADLDELAEQGLDLRIKDSHFCCGAAASTV